MDVWVSPGLRSGGFSLPRQFAETLLATSRDSEPYTLELALHFGEDGRLEHLFVLNADCEPEIVRSVRLQLALVAGATQRAAEGRLVVYFGSS